jgi:hypothetical protein
MLARTLAALVLLLAACPAKPTTKAPPPGGEGPAAGSGSAMGSAADPAGPPAAGSGSADSDPPRPAGPKIGEPCGSGDTCGEGSCVSYRGIAGARGPEFKSCEIRCDQGACRDGRKCITIADGPGQVCR